MTSQKCRAGPFDFEFFIVFGSGLGLDEGRFAWTWARQYTYKIEQKFKKFNMLLTVRVICKMILKKLNYLLSIQRAKL